MADGSPQERAYLALRDDDATYFGRKWLPGDIFAAVIKPYLSSPYRARVPTVGELVPGASYILSELPVREQRYSPLATMNARGEFVVSHLDVSLEARAVQLHGAYNFASVMPCPELPGWRPAPERYVIAFSASQVAICELHTSMIGGSKYTIRIRHTDAPVDAVDVARLEHTNSRDVMTHIFSNGDGVLYVSDCDHSFAVTPIITRYTLSDDRTVRRWIVDKFFHSEHCTGVFCATANFICIQSPGAHSVYALPSERANWGDLVNISPLMIGRLIYAWYTTQSVSLDSVGNLFGVSMWPDSLEVWSYACDSKTRHVLAKTEKHDYRNPLYRPLPVLHPSGRIFIVHERMLDNGKRAVCAQELEREEKYDGELVK